MDLADEGAQDGTNNPTRKDGGTIPEVPAKTNTAPTGKDTVPTMNGATSTEHNAGTISAEPTKEDLLLILPAPTENHARTIPPVATVKVASTIPVAPTRKDADTTPEQTTNLQQKGTPKPDQPATPHRGSSSSNNNDTED